MCSHDGSLSPESRGGNIMAQPEVTGKFIRDATFILRLPKMGIFRRMRVLGGGRGLAPCSPYDGANRTHNPVQWHFSYAAWPILPKTLPHGGELSTAAPPTTNRCSTRRPSPIGGAVNRGTANYKIAAAPEDPPPRGERSTAAPPTTKSLQHPKTLPQGGSCQPRHR